MRLTEGRLKSIILEEINKLVCEGLSEKEQYYEIDALDENEEYCPVCVEEQQIEEKKKPCKPSKGKRFAKRVDGKCRSYGQAGKAKDGGDRIRPGTKKADAYCARSAKIKKCKNPPCANTLSRKKWKCRGSKSVTEETEPFQQAVKKGYRKMKIRLVGSGGNKYVSAGMKKPPYARAKSAPPGFGSTLEEEKLFEHWEQTTLKELEKLNEIDWKKEADLTANPDYKPPHERNSAIIEKLNDWVLEKSVQLLELGKKNAVRAVASIKWLIDKIDTFCDRFPKICKAVKITLTVVAFYLAFAYLIDNEAQAKLIRNGRPVDDMVVDAMKGNLVDIIDARRKQGGDTAELYKLLAQVDVLHDSKTPHDFMKGKEKVDKGLKITYDFVKDAWNQENIFKDVPKEEGREMVRQWIDVGERTTAWYRESTIKVKGFMSQTLDYGKTLAKKGQ
tara:strand:+ start:81 stop:1418 length:1338 start_codon:yes stop_codon:yes gene_type:complete